MISIIIPAYNEEGSITETIRVLQEFFSKHLPDFELVVVSDGSSDRTFEVARKLENDRVRVFSYTPNRGKGYALKYGFERSRGDPIIFFDAGLNFPPTQILEFLKVLEGGEVRSERGPAGFSTRRVGEGKPEESSSAERSQRVDLVIGSKRHPKSSVDYPWHRKLVSFGAQLIVKILFNLGVTDTQVGLKAFRRQVLEKIMPLVLVKRYAFDIELLALVQRCGFKIVEAPVQLRLKLSTAVNPRSLAKTLFDTLAVFYRMRILKYYSLPEEERRRLLKEYPVTPFDKALCFVLGDLLGREKKE